MPAGISYAAVLERLADSIRAFPKDLVIYDSDKPPDDYSLDLKVESLVSAADQAGLERFHLVNIEGPARAPSWVARAAEARPAQSHRRGGRSHG